MIPTYFDVHTHLNLPTHLPGKFSDYWQAIGERALKEKIWFVNIGTDSRSSALAVAQAKALGQGVWATVGLHPSNTLDLSVADFTSISELAEDSKVVAIGECGLDYFRLAKDNQTSSSSKTKQKELFKKHLGLALALDKPVMIHCREAYNDLLEILTEYKKLTGNRLRFNLHFFTADWITAEKFLALDGYLSFPGVITFTDQYDEIIKRAPLERLLSETDAPFATPTPYRGQLNEPAYVRLVADKIVSLRPEPSSTVLTALVNNARTFYQLTF